MKRLCLLVALALIGCGGTKLDQAAKDKYSAEAAAVYKAGFDSKDAELVGALAQIDMEYSRRARDDESAAILWRSAELTATPAEIKAKWSK